MSKCSRRSTRWLAAVVLNAICVATMAAESANSTVATVPPGKALFDRWCAECHAPGHGHPGTQQLGWAKGEKFAVLEQRRDLNPALIKFMVRNGLNAMPTYRPSEISDAELEQLAAYLAPPAKRRR